MNTLREKTNTLSHSPSSDIEIKQSSMTSETTVAEGKPKSSLKKEELEKIAKQLKNKLSKASITAKQSLSPTALKTKTTTLKSSPLKNHMLKDQFHSPHNNSIMLSSSPNGLYSPNGKSPTQINSPSAIFLSSSPLKNSNSDDGENEIDSPSKKRKINGRDSKSQPQMTLQQIYPPQTPPKTFSSSIKPSPVLTSKQSEKSKPQQTTPVLAERQIALTPSQNPLLKTPTQSRPSTNGSFNDEEGADLLMYLATSPSPAKQYYSNTPNLSNANMHVTPYSAPTSSGSSNKPSTSGNSQNSFIAPPPPLTPKRPLIVTTRTPQNRLTPSVNLFNTVSAANGGLPSSGLTLTPAGFNMNDYVNFFTPSPGGTNMHNANVNSSKAFLKTPDFNNMMNTNQKQRVDGKMINFDKVLFGNGNSNIENPSKE